jgi:hypothetical protein
MIEIDLNETMGKPVINVTFQPETERYSHLGELVLEFVQKVEDSYYKPEAVEAPAAVIKREEPKAEVVESPAPVAEESTPVVEEQKEEAPKKTKRKRSSVVLEDQI